MNYKCFDQERVLMALESHALKLLGSEVTADCLQKIHNDFGANWHTERKKSDEGFQVIALGSTKPPKIIVGVDLPILVCTERYQKSKGVVMIIGQDPLRNPRDFPNPPHSSESRLIVGTPYAFHTSYYRDGRTLIYLKIVECVLELGFDVYLTDAYKFGYISTSRDEKWKRLGERADVVKILASEVELMKPIHVITLGKIAQDVFLATQPPTVLNRVLLPHPKARCAAWEQIMESTFSEVVPYTDDNKVTAISNILSKRLGLPGHQ